MYDTMNLEFSEQTRMLRQEIRRFVDEEFRPVLNDVGDEIERYHELDPENPELTDNVRPHPIKIPEDDRERLRERAKEVGFWAMGVPEEYGGGGLSLVERCVVLEELSKHRMGLYQAGLGVIELGPAHRRGAIGVSRYCKRGPNRAVLSALHRWRDAELFRAD